MQPGLSIDPSLRQRLAFSGRDATNCFGMDGSMAVNVKQVLLLRPQDVKDVIDIGTAIDLVEQGYSEATARPMINAPRRRVHSKANVRVSNFPGGVDGLNVIGSMTRGELVAHEKNNQNIAQRE